MFHKGKWTNTIATIGDFKAIHHYGHNEVDGEIFVADTHEDKSVVLKGYFFDKSKILTKFATV
jgi:hypothetical protein